MSLIYNTLEKIESDGGGKKTGGRVVSKKKASSSPVSLVLLAVILSAVIYFIYMGYEHYTKKKSVKKPVSPVKQTIPVTQNQYIQKVEDLEESPVIPEYEINQETFPENADSGGGIFTKASIDNNKEQNNATIDKTIPPVHINKNQQAVIQNNAAYIEQDPVIIKSKNDIKQLNRTTKIINTVAEIRKTLRITNDPGQLNNLLNKLKKLKGSNNNYVLKLEAVIHMKGRNFETAEDILKKIIVKNNTDREIEINLAVIELNTERAAKAKKRLQKLNQQFPEDNQVLQLLKECTTRL